MRGINPPVLFELHAEMVAVCKDRNAVDLCHILHEKDALVSTEARLARPVDIPKWSTWQDLHLQPFRLERNASSLGYTRLVPTVGLAPTLCAF